MVGQFEICLKCSHYIRIDLTSDVVWHQKKNEFNNTKIFFTGIVF
ncbi:MAG: hypothetical protein CM15mP127_12950 [Gammaproteobacteria bacterium]|nr:MAG: hypothetical protein CM15mP127_12950 [Gammaproteobacteria bacterium]